MKLLVFALLVASAAAWPHYFNDAAGKTNSHKQYDIVRLLIDLNDDIYKEHADLYDYAHGYDPVADLSHYNDGGEAAQKLYNERDHLLEREHYFSLFNENHRKYSLHLFEVFMSCKDYDTFIANAGYYKDRMNEGQFVYALYVAVVHSPLTKNIALPPLYEVTPHLFVNSEIIQEAYGAQMRHEDANFHMQFTGSKRNPEQRIAYFGEDIGLNNHHVSWHMDFPFWWEDKYGHHLDRKGELFFWVHHQLTARFDAERLSNYLDVVDELHWDDKIVQGFAPHTTYRYGGEFPSRPDNIYFEDVDGVARVRDMLIIESRIIDAIDHGYFLDHDGKPININDEHGIDILGDVIESSMYSPNPEYYGALHNLAHIMLGRQADPHGKFNMPPGVMEHFETATRDPSFFRLHKYMDNIFKKHKDSLPPYSKDELIFEGIALDDVKVEGDLTTYFENFTFSISNAVYGSEDVKKQNLAVDVERLNHKPFSLKFEVENNNGAEAIGTFRVYLCPRYDYNHVPYSFEEGRYGCIEIDKFWHKLASGHNTVVRDSKDSSVTVPDRFSLKELVEKSKQSIDNGDEVNYNGYHRSCGIPNRLLIPKGNTHGLEFVLAVAVTDGSKDLAIDNKDKLESNINHAHCGVHGEKYPDKRPLGYPLDRRIPDPKIYLEVPNFYRTYVTIKHEEHH